MDYNTVSLLKKDVETFAAECAKQVEQYIAEIDAMGDNAEAMARAWFLAKINEDSAKHLRSYISRICADIMPVPEGAKSKTHTVGAFRVTVKPATNIRVDWSTFDARYSDYCATTPADDQIDAPTKVKREIDEKGLQWIRENAKELYSAIAPAITVTPGTTGLTVDYSPKKDAGK